MAKQDWRPILGVAVRLDAGHDVNGNPLRAWMVLDARTGNIADVLDEGYGGRNVQKRLGYVVSEGPDILVRPGYYRDLIRFAKKELKIDPYR